MEWLRVGRTACYYSSRLPYGQLQSFPSVGYIPVPGLHMEGMPSVILPTLLVIRHAEAGALTSAMA